MIATPMVDCFTNKPDLTPYKVQPNQIPLDLMNPKIALLKGKQKYLTIKSMELALCEADDDVLYKILWFASRGYNMPYSKIRI